MPNDSYNNLLIMEVHTSPPLHMVGPWCSNCLPPDRSLKGTFEISHCTQGCNTEILLCILGADEKTFLVFVAINFVELHYIGLFTYIGFKVDGVTPSQEDN